MATVSASFTFNDGDSVGASVEVATGYPDALAEAVKTCVDMIREVMVLGICAQDGDDED